MPYPVNTRFYDPGFNGVNWMEISQQYRKKIATVADKQACYNLINEMLATLKVSHTQLYSQDDPWYYILKSISVRLVDYGNRIKFPQIGIFTISDGYGSLYLAIGQILIDEKTLEGIGVTPDVFVESPIEYSGGQDPPLERAISMLTDDQIEKR